MSVKVLCSFLFLILILYSLGFRLLVVISDSMEPTIKRGSLVLVIPKWLKGPREGSIVLIRVRLSREYLILHRIVRVNNGTYYTKGDNRAFLDPWTLKSDNIMGVAVLAIPYLGYFMLVMRPLAVLILIGLLVYYVVRRILAKIL